MSIGPNVRDLSTGPDARDLSGGPDVRDSSRAHRRCCAQLMPGGAQRGVPTQRTPDGGGGSQGMGAVEARGCRSFGALTAHA